MTPQPHTTDRLQVSWLRRDDLCCPTFVCDTCGRPITTPKDAIVEWLYAEDYTTVVRWRVRHKAFVCGREREPEASWFWEDLGVFLSQLMMNTGCDDDPRAAEEEYDGDPPF